MSHTLTDYEEYLKSDTWIKKRNEAFLRDGFKCVMCGTGKNIRGHHVRYPKWKDLGKEPIDDIITLCDSCHKAVHSEDLKCKKALDIACDVASYLWNEGYDESSGGRYMLTNPHSYGSRLPGIKQCIIDNMEDIPHASTILMKYGIEEISNIAAEIVNHRIGSFICSSESYFYGAYAISMEYDRAYRIAKKYEQKSKEKSKRFRELEEIMKAKDWTAVEPACDFKRLPAGGYVLQITGVEDVASKEYLRINYEVFEGSYKDFYSDQPDWVCSMVKWYGEKAEGFFRKFLDILEESNPQFDIKQWQNGGCNEQAFLGLIFGGLIQKWEKTNTKGKDVTIMEVASCVPVDDIRSGNFTLPEPRDTREGSGQQQQAVAEQKPYDDVPF